MRYKLLLLVLGACFTLVKLSAQEYGTLIVDSDSLDIEVFINGEKTGLSTPFREELEVGSYAVELRFSLFKSYKETVNILANEVTTVYQNEPLLNGNLLINSSPAEALVYIDTLFLGTTPFAADSITPGLYKFTFKKENYNDGMLKVMVEPDKVTEALAELTAGYGTISILANPEADIFIDEKYEGNRMYNGRMPTGSHLIEVKKEGYATQAKIINVVEGEAYREFFELKPMYGKISIITHPHYASIYLNDELIGKSPRILDDIFVGEYKLRLEKEGFATLEKTVTVEHNQTVYITEELRNGLIVTTEPDSVSIYLNEKFIGLSPQFISDLATGIYNVILKKDGYPEIKKVVDYKENTSVELHEKMVDGFLVTSEPEGAKIYIDGAHSGVTPKMFTSLTDTHTVLLTLEGYADVSKEVVFDKSLSRNIHQVLSTGFSVKIKTNTDDAEIWINDEMVGISEVIVPLEAGEHKAVFKNSLYYNDLEVLIQASENGQVEEFTLNNKMCMTSFISKPKSATVYLNDKKMFKTNESSIIKGGLYNLRLESKQFHPITEEISISESDQTFSYTLVPKKYRSKGVAVLLTTVFPGAGRAYLTRGESTAISGFAFYGLGYGAYHFDKKSADLRTEANNASISERNSLIEESDQNKLYSDVMLYSAAGIWAFNFIRTLATPSEKKKYSKLNLTTYYNPQSQTQQIGLVMNF